MILKIKKGLIMKKFIISFILICSSVFALHALTLGEVLDKASIESTGFTAKIKVENVTPDEKKFIMNMTLFVKGQKTRTDLTYTQSSMPDVKMFQQMKMLGLDQMSIVSVLSGDKYNATFIFPRNEAYIEQSVKKNTPEAEQLGSFDEAFDNVIEKVGEEDFYGIKCDKYKKILDNKEAKSYKEIFIFINPSNKTYAGQISIPTAGGKTIIVFSGYEFTVNETVFTVPSGYTKFADQNAMIMEIMKDMQGG